MKTFTRIGLALLMAATMGLSSEAALAGCGCDHPPPSFSTVMPSFASPGSRIRIDSNGNAFEVGRSYTVTFGGTRAKVIAEVQDHLLVTLPDAVPPGPVAIEVSGRGSSRTYDEALFTALPPAYRLDERTTGRLVTDYAAAVSADGTVLIPIDLSGITAAMQLTVQLKGLELAFGPEEVVFFNGDGVDLTLFTLAVEDPIERQWGSYYGWSVEEDSGLYGDVFETKTIEPTNGDSALLTYWRHEFMTYAEAHAPGGSHEVDANGYHPDGSWHIDHGHVVIALDGTAGGARLAGGATSVDLLLWTMLATAPLEPDEVRFHMAMVDGVTALVDSSPELLEATSDLRLVEQSTSDTEQTSSTRKTRNSKKVR